MSEWRVYVLLFGAAYLITDAIYQGAPDRKLGWIAPVAMTLRIGIILVFLMAAVTTAVRHELKYPPPASDPKGKEER